MLDQRLKNLKQSSTCMLILQANWSTSQKQLDKEHVPPIIKLDWKKSSPSYSSKQSYAQLSSPQASDLCQV
jgi:hypothetical protein